MSKKRLDEVLRSFKHTKKLDAKHHLGKVKWHKDALGYFSDTYSKKRLEKISRKMLAFRKKICLSGGY